MTNSNCLADIRCPKCGYEDEFYIRAESTVLVTDNGTEEVFDQGGYEWDESSPCTCRKCGHHDMLVWFSVQIQDAHAPHIKEYQEQRKAKLLADMGPELLAALEEVVQSPPNGWGIADAFALHERCKTLIVKARRG